MWKSNFGRPTPSTRRCRRDRINTSHWLISTQVKRLQTLAKKGRAAFKVKWKRMTAKERQAHADKTSKAQGGNGGRRGCREAQAGRAGAGVRRGDSSKATARGRNGSRRSAGGTGGPRGRKPGRRRSAGGLRGRSGRKPRHRSATRRGLVGPRPEALTREALTGEAARSLLDAASRAEEEQGAACEAIADFLEREARRAEA